MPTVLTSAINEAEEQRGLVLFDAAGGLTLPGQAMVDFLEHADTSRVFSHALAEGHVLVSGASADLKFLPGPIAHKALDKRDLVECFGEYLELRAARGSMDEANLADKAMLRVLEESFGLEDGYSKGAFRRCVQSDAGRQMVESALEEVFGRSIVQESGSPEFRTGLSKEAHQVQAASRQRSAGRIGRAMLDESFEPSFLLGEGVVFEGAKFELATDSSVKPEEPSLTVLIESDLSEADVELIADLLKRYAPLPLSEDDSADEEYGGAHKGKKKMKKKGMEYPDESIAEFAASITDEADRKAFDALIEKSKIPPQFLSKMKKKKGDDETDEGKREGAAQESVTSPGANAGVFGAAAGRPGLNEGASLSAQTLNAMGFRKEAAAKK